MKEIEKYASPSIEKFLVGNKIDLENERVVKTSEGQQYARINQMGFLETSAKESINIEKAFFEIGENIKNKLMKYEDKNQINNLAKPKQLQNAQQINAADKKQKCC